MPLVRMEPEFFETFTIVTSPTRSFGSSSLGGLTGSIRTYSRTNNVIKSLVLSPDVFASGAFNDQGGSGMLIEDINALDLTNINGHMSTYMEMVNSASLLAKYDQTASITRFVPGFDTDKYFQRKVVIRDSLMPYYRVRYPTAQYAYTNYHTLNFFTASSVPTGSVLIYPNSGTATGSTNNYVYTPNGPFTLDFQINPRYTVRREGETFRAGTIFH